MNLPIYARNYLLAALEGSPEVVEALLKSVPFDSPRWDFTPDPERFTLREVVAHLADWEPIWLERIILTRDQDQPHLPDKDEGKLAIERNYKHSDPRESIMRFREGRMQVLALLRSLPEEAWQRIAHRERVGILSIEMMASLILSHDGYHTKQIAQWLVKSATL